MNRAGMRVLVLGDGMTDRYIVGDISRLNPEDHAAPLLNVSNSLEFPGGAANVAANVAALIGRDCVDFISGRGMIEKVRVMHGSRIVCRYDLCSRLLPIPTSSVPDISQYDAIIVSDYDKGSISKEIVSLLKRDTPKPMVFVDTKAAVQDWTGVADFMFPNRSEYLANAQWYEKAPNVVVKKAQLGASLMRYGRKVVTVDAVSKCPKNVSGAGDTVIAAFACAYLANLKAGLNDYSCLEFAMDAAAIAVEDPHTAAPTLQEIICRFPRNSSIQDSILRTSH